MCSIQLLNFRMRNSIFFILIGVVLAGCITNERNSKYSPTAQDSINLIQTMLDNRKLNDSLFSIQISQNLIIHKDNRVPLNAKFKYKGSPAVVRVEKFGVKYSDYQNPRFLIAFGDCMIKKDSARLSFIMPDVGLGVSSLWARADQETSWMLSEWNIEYY